MQLGWLQRKISKQVTRNVRIYSNASKLDLVYKVDMIHKNDTDGRIRQISSSRLTPVKGKDKLVVSFRGSILNQFL